MNLDLNTLECLAIFLRERFPLWRAHARLFKVDPENLPRLIAQAHALKVKETMDKRLTNGRPCAGKRNP